MNYPKSEAYRAYHDRIMGPNPMKLTEELLLCHQIPAGAAVMDLGSGQGVTSLFLAREYGFRVWAADLWSDPAEIQAFFDTAGPAGERLTPVHADAAALPFAPESFDAVVSVDSYHYFGRDPEFLDTRLLPFLKPGGWVYIAIPGMKRDCHDHLPEALRRSWTPEDLDTIHDAAYWRRILSGTKGAALRSLREMESNEECWADWIQCENPYAVGDRKAIEAGACRYLNFLAIVLQKH